MSLDPETLAKIIPVLAPGFLIMFVRRQFTVAAPRSVQDRAISYAAISAVYFAVSVPLFSWLRSFWNLPLEFYRAAEYLALPLMLGMFFAWFAKERKFDSWWSKIGLHPIHHIPSAWDYIFSRVTVETWLLVTLDDGSQVAGKFCENSFASSDCSERDLFISDVWEVQDEGDWVQAHPPRGILLCGKDIRLVELLYPANETESEEINVRQKR